MWWLAISESLLRSATAQLKPRSRVITPATPYPTMNDKIQNERPSIPDEGQQMVKSDVLVMGVGDLERFDSKFDEKERTECWIWKGAPDTLGYGRFKLNNGMRRAHRVSYRKHHGPIPDGLFVCHKCDVRLCVNPAHLFLGTANDNNQDAVSKGRNRGAPGDKNGSVIHPETRLTGERNWNSKLTEKDVLEMRMLRKTENTSYRKLGMRYGVSHRTVRHIILRNNWKHVT